MDPRLRERIERWESRPLEGHESLVDAVSGAVLAEAGHLFVHDGRLVGGEGDPARVVETGRLHVAPAPALALGYAMAEAEPDARRSYDARETPPGALHDVLAADERTCYVDPADGPEPRGEWTIAYEAGRLEAAAAVDREVPLTGEAAVEHVSRALEGYEVVEVSIDPVDPVDPVEPGDSGDPGEPDKPNEPNEPNEDPRDRPRGDDAEGELARIASRLEALERGSDREGLVAENRELRETVSRLERRVEELEGESGEEVEADLGPEEALSGTNLFVRYASKGEPTVADADSSDRREAIRSNLRLDYHVEFDEPVTVSGRPFEEFLEATMEYRFVDWLVGTLPFEIRETGHADALADLDEAIPEIDRVEFDATLALDGDETATFDVVAFDKHGSALVTATVHDSREPVGREVVADLEEATSRATSASPGIAAAMVVASSYFDPEALEVVSGVTGGGGFLGRSSKRSYVTLSRKRGYHLCLVEARREELYLSTPDL